MIVNGICSVPLAYNLACETTRNMQRPHRSTEHIPKIKENKQTLKKILSVILVLLLMIGLASSAAVTTPAIATAPASPALSALSASNAGNAELDAAVGRTAAYIQSTVTNPSVDSIGGDWAALGLARSGYDVPDSYFQIYYTNVEQYVAQCKGVLHDRKYTEYSRVILGLTAAGFDPRDVAGYDLTAALGDFDRTILQGLNSTAYALLALDSEGYAIPTNAIAKTQATRGMYIEEILRLQLNGGGWNLTGGAAEGTKNQPADPDTTGIVLQALAKYQSNDDVAKAINKALVRLSDTQKPDGGYEGWGGSNIESAAQVLVALCELGIPADDGRFVKNGNSIVDFILSSANSDGSFNHTSGGGSTGGSSLMSTEQAFYALVAALRATSGKSSLYRMSDAEKRDPPPSQPGDGPGTTEPAMPGLPGKHADVKSLPVIYPGKTFADIHGHINQVAIESLAARGIINGKSETSFDPNATMTRAEFATIAVRGLGLTGIATGAVGADREPVETGETGENTESSATGTGSASDAGITGAPGALDSPGSPGASLESPAIPKPKFTDVNDNDWFYTFVYTAQEYGLINGRGDGTFDPNGTLTRQEAAVIIAHAAKLCGMSAEASETAVRDVLSQFVDYRKVADWATESMAFCYSAGILDNSALEIEPNMPVKRCEIADMLYRLLLLCRL